MKKFITLSVLSTVFLGLSYQGAEAASASKPMASASRAHHGGRVMPPIALIQACIEFAHNMRERPRLAPVAQMPYTMLLQSCKAIVDFQRHREHQAYLENIEAVDVFFEMAAGNQRLGLSEEARAALEKGHETEARIRQELEEDPRRSNSGFGSYEYASYFEYASYALSIANGHGNPHNEERNEKKYQNKPNQWGGWGQWGHFSQNDIDGPWLASHEEPYIASMDHARRGMHDSLVKPRQQE